jgi:hypothetical protein
MLSVESSTRVMDEFSEHLPTKMARQEMLELLSIMDRVATEELQKRQEIIRKNEEATRPKK